VVETREVAGMSQDIERRLWELEAKQGAVDCLNRYCQACDLQDYDALGARFAPAGQLRNKSVYAGRDDIVAYFRSVLPTIGSTRHYILNPIPTLVEQDGQTVVKLSSYFYATHTKDENTNIIWGDYEDTVGFVDGEWRFLEKVNGISFLGRLSPEAVPSLQDAAWLAQQRTELGTEAS
jgi:hypothetical protein